jgi:hypothetical protein
VSFGKAVTGLIKLVTALYFIDNAFDLLMLNLTRAQLHQGAITGLSATFS